MEKVAVSLALALVINALVAVGAAVAALDVAPVRGLQTDLIVSSSALKPADVIAVRNTVSGQASASPITSRSEPLNVIGRQTTVTVEGVQPNFEQLAGWQVEQGRFFTSQDDAALSALAVVSEGIDPTVTVGQTIRIRDVPFTIVGVGRAALAQNVVLVPLRTGQIRLFGASAIDQIFVQVAPESEAASVRGEVEQLLRKRHNLRLDQADDFSISDVVPESPGRSPITGTSVLRVIEQFVCTAKNSCARMAGINTRLGST